MSGSASITEKLLFSYFAGQATPLQKRLIEKWITEPENEEVFYAVLHKWETGNIQYHANVNQAIQKFHSDILQDKPSAGLAGKKPRVKTSPVTASVWGKWLVAATLLFLLGVSVYFYREAILYKIYTTGFEKTRPIHLEDGSKVVLNVNSRLKVPRFFFSRTARTVYLKGEACFSVAHTPENRRFVVQTDSLFEVEVLGTEFSVFARPRQTKVVLMKGNVKLHYHPIKKEAPAYTMVPGDLVTVNKKQGKLEIKKVMQPENYVAWMQNRFVFDNTSLNEIKDIIRENYGLTVDLKGEKIAERTISGSFRATTVNKFLESIAHVLDIQVSRQNNHVTLTKN